MSRDPKSIDPLTFLAEIQAEAQIAKNQLRKKEAINGYKRFDKIEKLAADAIRLAPRGEREESAA